MLVIIHAPTALLKLEYRVLGYPYPVLRLGLARLGGGFRQRFKNLNVLNDARNHIHPAGPAGHLSGPGKK